MSIFNHGRIKQLYILSVYAH